MKLFIVKNYFMPLETIATNTPINVGPACHDDQIRLMKDTLLCDALSIFMSTIIYIFTYIYELPTVLIIHTRGQN